LLTAQPTKLSLGDAQLSGEVLRCRAELFLQEAFCRSEPCSGQRAACLFRLRGDRRGQRVKAFGLDDAALEGASAPLLVEDLADDRRDEVVNLSLLKKSQVPSRRNPLPERRADDSVHGAEDRPFSPHDEPQGDLTGESLDEERPEP
jgi:hypothetical protein